MLHIYRTPLFPADKRSDIRLAGLCVRTSQKDPPKIYATKISIKRERPVTGSPAYALRRFRPFLRRAATTRRPPTVRIRDKKP